jgi:TolA-binding protein
MLTQFVTQALSQSSVPAPDASTGSASPGSPALPPSAGNAFDQAWSAYMAGQNDVAIQGFQDYLRRFPGSPDAAKAQFYIGEAYFNFNPGKFQDAAAAYDLVLTTAAYKGSEYVPQAYYKQGLAYEALRKPELAKKNYELLRRDFSDTSWAIAATNMLRKMGAIK